MSVLLILFICLFYILFSYFNYTLCLPEYFNKFELVLYIPLLQVLFNTKPLHLIKDVRFCFFPAGVPFLTYPSFAISSVDIAVMFTRILFHFLILLSVAIGTSCLPKYGSFFQVPTLMSLINHFHWWLTLCYFFKFILLIYIYMMMMMSFERFTLCQTALQLNIKVM